MAGVNVELDLDELEQVPLTKDRALALQKELLAKFSAPLFQALLLECEQDFKDEPIKFKRAQQDLVLTAQKEVLPKFGYEGSVQGVSDMRNDFKLFSEDADVSANKLTINRLIGQAREEDDIDRNSIMQLTREKALALQVELLAAVGDKDFQVSLQRCAVQHGYDSLDFKKDQQELLLNVQKGIIPKYGFKGNLEGVYDMRTTFTKFSNDDQVKANTETINKLVGKTRDRSAEALRQSLLWEVEAREESRRNRRDEPLVPSASVGVELDMDAVRVPLDVKTGLAMQNDLRLCFAKYSFQRRLHDAAEKYGCSSLQFRKVREDLVFGVQKDILPKYGFQPTPEGVMEMRLEFKNINADPEISANIEAVNKLLGVDATSVRDLVPFQKQETQLHVEANTGYFTVVDDTKHGGLLVRLGESLQSTAFPDRLKSGAIVKLTMYGSGGSDRVYVEKVSGRGPNYGWVTRKTEKKVFLEPFAGLITLEAPKIKEDPALKSIPTILTKEKALALQGELYVAYSDLDFQAALYALEEEHGADSIGYAKERLQMLLDAQKKILPKYGFEASVEGAVKMREKIQSFADDDRISANIESINWVLGQKTIGETETKREIKAIEDKKTSAEKAIGQKTNSETKKKAETKATEEKTISSRGMINLYIVVADTRNGGILVRVGESLGSSAYAESLATGAIVKVIMIGADPTRVYYEKLSGDGPNDGWVSLKIKDKILLEPYKGDTIPIPKKPIENKITASTPAAPKLSRESALALQKELYEAYADLKFQMALAELRESHDVNSSAFVKARLKLLLDIQKPILPRYGFEASLAGATEMQAAFSEFNKDAEIGAKIRIVDHLIGNSKVAQAKSSQKQQDDAPKEDTLALKDDMPELWFEEEDKGLTVESALALQDELIASYSKREFQVKLGRLMEKYPEDSDFKKARSKLVLSAKKDVLPRYGFEANLSGASQMANAFLFFSDNAEISHNFERINQLLSRNSDEESRRASAGSSGRRPSDVKESAVAIPSEPEPEPFKKTFILKDNDQYFKVVGNTRNGGILVRLGEDTFSKAERQPLGTGAIVRVSMWGRMPNRMCYEKLSGSGPGSGWVSLSANGVDLLQPYDGEVKVSRDPTEFNKAKALLLQRELCAKYSMETFQNSLQQLGNKFGANSAMFLKQRWELVVGVQKEVIPKYGFEPTDDGVQRMRFAIQAYSKDEEISTNMRVVNKLLKVGKDDW